MTVSLDPAVTWSLGLSLGLMLGLAAAHKFRSLSRFCATLAGYRLVPAVLLAPVAALVIATEIGAALLVVAPAGRSLGGLLVAGLMVIYSGAIAANLLRGRARIDCGCLGAGTSERIAWWMVGRNLLVAGIGLAVRLPAGARPLEGLDWLTVIGTVTAAAILFAAASRLAALPSLQRGAA